MKTCTVCNTSKDLDSFYKMKSSKDGFSYRCKQCDNKARQKWRDTNPERSSLSARRRSIKHKYDISLEEYDAMLLKQNGKCAICGCCANVPYNNFCVDHCHESGVVRGLLCNTCNRAIGLLKDNVSVLKKAIVYLSETH